MATSDQHFTLRVLAFLALVVGVNLWLDHHLGVGFANASAVSMVSAAVAGGLGLLAKLLPKDEHAALVTRALSTVRVVFWPPLLVAAWIVALILALTLSSVTVVAEAEGKSFKVGMSSGVEPRAPDEASFRVSKDGVVRIPVTTNPFGRVMRLTVAGYVPATLDVYPLVGRRVVLGSDMRPSPSVLLRLPAGVHGHQGPGNDFVVKLLGGRDIANVTRQPNTSAFLIGRRREIPSSLRRDWDIDLEAEGVTRSAGAEERAKMLKEWRDPTPLETTITLEPGMTLVAELRAPGGVVASTTVTLGPEPFQDVALR